jgi:NADH-quinone oxidoreductase subunit I
MGTYFKDIKDGLWTAMVGMKITFGHLFQKNVTIQYPDEKHFIPDRARNRLYVNMDDCIGCDQCSKACPVNCITIETIKALPTDDLGETSTGNKKRLWVPKFDIDFAKCCYCGLCVFPCPTECIFMTKAFEFTEYKRNDLLYHFSTMTAEQVAAKQAEVDAFNKEQEAKKAAAAEAKKKADEAAAQAKKEADAAAAAAQTNENQGS